MISPKSVKYMLLTLLYASAARNNPSTDKVDKEIKEFVEAFMKARAKLVENLDADVDQLDKYYADTAEGRRQLIEEKIILGTKIEHNRLQEIDLKALWHQIGIYLEKIEKQESSYSVIFTVDEIKRYAHIAGDTVLKNQKHAIKLLKVDNRWYVEEHHYEDEFKDVLYAYKKKLNREDLEEVKQMYLSSVRSSVALWQKREEIVLEPIDIILEKVDKEQTIGIYDRERAVAYALQYALEPSPEWKDYSEYGGDCTNFTSQCLYSGRLPFTTQRGNIMKEWYWYSDEVRTPSWTSSRYFLQYILADNRKEGIVARLGKRKDLQLGDIVQLGVIGATSHSMIVTKIVYSKINKDRVLDYLICQHSENARNIPLSSKPIPRVYILIEGYKKLGRDMVEE